MLFINQIILNFYEYTKEFNVYIESFYPNFYERPNDYHSQENSHLDEYRNVYPAL